MDAFFHGWRRKTGCVTLVAALIVRFFRICRKKRGFANLKRPLVASADHFEAPFAISMSVEPYEKKRV